MEDTTHANKFETYVNKPAMVLQRSLSASTVLYPHERQQQEVCEILYTRSDEQEQQKYNAEKKILDDFEIVYTDSDQQEQQNSNNNGEKKIQQDYEVLKQGANIIVAKDHTGKCKTVNDAIKMAPDNSKTRFVIYVKGGTYNEVVHIASTKTNITLVGDGRDKTFLTGSLNNVDGVKTFDSATLAVDGPGFIGRDICIEYVAKPTKNQAVAVRVTGDASALYRCSILGFQDTLYAHKNRQFYCECYITGSVDFICGDAKAVFQNCHIEVKKSGKIPINMITAQKRENPDNNTAFSFQNCTVSAHSDLARIKKKVKTYLGRPWGDYSRVVFMSCVIDKLIDPAGWCPWDHDSPQKQKQKESTVYYGEYKNRGLGAGTSKRVSWEGFKIITDTKEAENFTGEKILYPDSWVKATGIPYHGGLY